MSDSFSQLFSWQKSNLLVETVLLYADECLLKTVSVMRNVLPLVVGCGPWGSVVVELWFS